MRTLALSLLVALTAIAGCLSDDGTDDEPMDTPAPVLGDVIDALALVDDSVLFTESVVTAAMSYTNDLYEPTMDVSVDGTIYITAHTIVVDVGGPPAFVSTDEGASWASMAFAGPAAMPSPLPGSNPGPSDEIFIVAGDDGWAYGADITAATFPVTMWSDDGSNMAYYNPNAFDRVSSTIGCNPVALNDRPWAAYANGTLLIANNPGNGYAQIAVMEVPPALPTDPVGNPATGPEWNFCAGSAGSYIPGIPDIRDDGLFAIPNIMGGERLDIILGNKADIFDVQQVTAFPFTNSYEYTSVYGQTVFDGAGDLFVGVTNNTAQDDEGAQHGQFIVAVSQDDGQTFKNRTFTTGRVIESLYFDASLNGTGTQVVWAVAGETEGTSDWFVGHIQVGADGAPVLTEVLHAIDDGPRASPHVTGSAVGPDGRAYLATYNGGITGSTPLSVWIQQDGPVL